MVHPGPTAFARTCLWCRAFKRRLPVMHFPCPCRFATARIPATPTIVSSKILSKHKRLPRVALGMYVGTPERARARRNG
jgi:hypothetical protein